LAVTIFEQAALDTDNRSQLSTLVLRGSTNNVLEDFDRAVTDAVHAYKTFTKVT
jgi:chaperonin GroEL (HSP60 family)